MQTKQKVIAYIYRIKNHQTEVLVFDHDQMPEAGTQVVGGTVEEGEDFDLAMLREINEESGLHFKNEDLFPIGKSVYFRRDRDEKNLRYYYKVKGDHLSDHFSHRVHSDGEDNQLLFHFYWMTIDVAKISLTGNFGELLHLLVI
jgi:ADP-ribose pyrophosphatase YjhB (NUDIX family)